MGKKFVLSLGSGGLRGYVHLGVYKALHENNIKIDAIYGCSVGALIGAFISEGWEPDKLVELAVKISPLELVDVTFPRNGYVAGKKLTRFAKGGGSYASSGDRRLIFGLAADSPGPLTVHWPDGNEQRLEGLAADRYHRIRQGNPRPLPEVGS